MGCAEEVSPVMARVVGGGQKGREFLAIIGALIWLAINALCRRVEPGDFYPVAAGRSKNVYLWHGRHLAGAKRLRPAITPLVENRLDQNGRHHRGHI